MSFGEHFNNFKQSGISISIVLIAFIIGFFTMIQGCDERSIERAKIINEGLVATKGDAPAVRIAHGWRK